MAELTLIDSHYESIVSPRRRARAHLAPPPTATRSPQSKVSLYTAILLPLIWSTVTAIFAKRAGLRWVLPVTRLPERTRLSDQPPGSRSSDTPRRLNAQQGAVRTVVSDQRQRPRPP